MEVEAYDLSFLKKLEATTQRIYMYTVSRKLCMNLALPTYQINRFRFTGSIIRRFQILDHDLLIFSAIGLLLSSW